MQDGYMGVIQALGFQFAPLNWAYCAGQLISIGQQSALFSLLGCEFGGDCRSVFGYPDLRGRTPIGQFQGPGLTNRVIGQMLGQEYFYMSLAQMPTHTHTHSYAGSGGGGSGLPASVEVATVAGNKATPDAGDYLAAVATATGSINTRALSPRLISRLAKLPRSAACPVAARQAASTTPSSRSRMQAQALRLA
ncbi:phage tail protein [Kordiimonas gwangyangensis]|uniref:phage tail protein n=1 Tax=Kordiimonas gwangyangensis TaxID=288022 RepID=UPI000471B717|nr:tail fiber protein [Kordiimonas gwangyangensis]